MESGDVILAGRSVRLEPLSLRHHAALTEAAADPAVSRWLPYSLATPPEVLWFIEDALQAQLAGTALPFATIDRATGSVAGSTRFLNIDRGNRRVEIGATFLAPRWQRTAINTEAKYLMLTYAFQTLDCIRVEFKTDALNQRSRQAILRLGAHEEGTLRSHMIVQGGRLRDSVYFSILASEWPAVKRRLEEKMERVVS